MASGAALPSLFSSPMTLTRVTKDDVLILSEVVVVLVSSDRW